MFFAVPAPVRVDDEVGETFAGVPAEPEPAGDDRHLGKRQHVGGAEAPVE